MSTELAKQEKTPIAVGSRGVQLRSFEDAWRFSVAVQKSGLAPSSFRTPEQVLIAIQYGQEVGFAPMQALQSIAVINGRPCLWGDALPALVRAGGECEYIKEWFEGEGDNLTAFCETKRKGETEPCRKSFSVADAKAAGLLSRKGPWQDYRPRMLQMRARSWCLRDTYADALRGLQVREEVEDYTHGIPAEVAEPAKPRLLSEIPVEPETVEDAETEPAGSFSYRELKSAIEKTADDDIDGVNGLHQDVSAAFSNDDICMEELAQLRAMLAEKIPY